MADVLELLIEERDRINQAIEVLTPGRATGGRKHNGRPAGGKWRREANRRTPILVSRSARSRRIVKTLDREGSVSRRKIQEVVARLG